MTDKAGGIKSRLFITAKPGDSVRVGSTVLKVVRCSNGKLQLCFEALPSTLIEFERQKPRGLE